MVGLLTDSRGFGIFDIYDFLLTIDYWVIWIPDYDIRGQARLGWLALSPCCAAAYDMQNEMLCLPAGKYMGILTLLQTIVNKKMNRKALFLAAPIVDGGGLYASFP